MANDLTVNPILIDTVGATSTLSNVKLRLLQWVDDNGDITHDSNLILTINGKSFEATIQPVANQLGFGAVAWQIGPFNPGIIIDEITVATMSAGQVHIWLQ